MSGKTNSPGGKPSRAGEVGQAGKASAAGRPGGGDAGPEHGGLEASAAGGLKDAAREGGSPARARTNPGIQNEGRDSPARRAAAWAGKALRRARRAASAPVAWAKAAGAFVLALGLLAAARILPPDDHAELHERIPVVKPVGAGTPVRVGGFKVTYMKFSPDATVDLDGQTAAPEPGYRDFAVKLKLTNVSKKLLSTADLTIDVGPTKTWRGSAHVKDSLYRALRPVETAEVWKTVTLPKDVVPLEFTYRYEDRGDPDKSRVVVIDQKADRFHPKAPVNFSTPRVVAAGTPADLEKFTITCSERPIETGSIKQFTIPPEYYKEVFLLLTVENTAEYPHDMWKYLTVETLDHKNDGWVIDEGLKSNPLEPGQRKMIKVRLWIPRNAKLQEFTYKFHGGKTGSKWEHGLNTNVIVKAP